jgi:hypothetical protein
MKFVKKSAAQGEMLVRRVASFNNEETTEMKAEGNSFILAHSETGHHHVIDKNAVEIVQQTGNVPEGLGILHMIVKEPTSIVHLRDNDTHEPLHLDEGKWEVRLQREFSPEGYRRVAD